MGSSLIEERGLEAHRRSKEHSVRGFHHPGHLNLLRELIEEAIV